MGRTDGGKKGSQLSQLKQSIRTSGLSRVSKLPVNGRTGDRSGKKAKSSISSATKDPEFRLKKLAEIQASQNLFDLKTSKIKFPTSTSAQARQKSLSRDGSKTLIRTVGKPAQSATQAHQRRVEKLLPEYHNRHKSSNFLDKRFGEGDSTLTPEEKALERFTKERQMRLPGGAKRNIFNLEEDAEGLYDDYEGGEGGLTHGGIGLDLDDDEGGQAEDDDTILKLNKRPLALDQLDEPADDGEPTKKKSKAEVMSEIITKSKAHKYQRQQLKDQDDDLRFDLDAELKDIRSLLCSAAAASAPTTHPEELSQKPVSVARCSRVNSERLARMNVINEDAADASDDASERSAPTDQIPKPSSASAPTVDRALLSKLLGSNKSPSPQIDEDDKDEDAYDRFVRELAFDARAKPSDRLKTAEEEAAEEADRLRMLEHQRLNRMRGLEDETEDGQHSGKKSRKAKRKPEADDLEDDFVSDREDEPSWDLGRGLRPDGAFGASVPKDEDSSASASDSDGDSDSGSDVGSASGESDWDGLSDGSARADREVDSEGNAPQPLVSRGDKKLLGPKTSAKESVHELAYTYPCPASHADFLAMLTQMSVKSSEVATVVQRIRVLYHPSLGEDNKSKLAAFANILIDHVIHVTSVYPGGSKSSPFPVVNALLPHIINLCQTFTQSSAMHFVSKLGIMQKNFTQTLTQQDGKGWPGLCELTLLRLIGLIWSTSDFSHPVVAPALLMICQYLNQLQVKEYTDMMSGLFMCTLILQYEALSKRLVPEAINFLLLSFLRLTFSKLDISSLPSTVPAPEGVKTLMFPVSNQASAKLHPETLDFSSLLTRQDDTDALFPSDQDKVDALDVVVSLLNNFSALYSSSSNYIEVFGSALDVIKSVDNPAIIICEPTRLRLEKLRTTIDDDLTASKRIRQLNPLRLQSHRPIPIKPQTPQFDSSFNPNQKAFNPDSAQVEVNKLKAQIKKEKKGAIRELRKDNKFLAIEKAREKDQVDQAYNAKIARITAGLQQERSEEKKQERTKVRLKKLDKIRGSKK